MGVVYVAFDPDLERRIALKVLRASNRDAAQRLQREAKAMARLAHPNVVTVYEVSSAGGQDYVAMELVEGESLAEWLRGERRGTAEVIDAFLAAGRGLAAAHAAGIVHRDFKPHNVLRGKGGRIAVTDFGLAREAVLDPDADPLATTLPVGADATTSTPSVTPSSLAGLTATGAVLGTPAYMAPEQWRAAAVSPATDQFAFCVALWEALAGARPFIGKTIEELRARIEEGPDALDASPLPRRLRSVVPRGLAVDPARRWPSMDALLARLAPARSRRIAVMAIGAAALAGAGVFALALGRSSAPGAPPCPAPALDLDAIWTPATAQAIAAGKQAENGRFLEAELRAWRDARARACTSDPQQRTARVACLDGVLSRAASVIRALPGLAGEPYVDAPMHLVDPAVCLQAVPPRLVVASPLFDEVMAAELKETAETDTPAHAMLVSRVDAAGDPCARALVHRSAVNWYTKEEASLAAAQQASEACGDDRIRADVALFETARALAQMTTQGTSATKLSRAEAAVQRVAQVDLVASLHVLKSRAAERIDDLDRAIEHMDAAAEGLAKRGRVAGELSARIEAAELRMRRGRIDDDAANAKLYDAWEARAQSALGDDAPETRRLQRSIALADFFAGRIESAEARMAKHRKREPQHEPISVHGKVVDERGAPIAGARIVAAWQLIGTSHTASMTFYDDGSWRETTSASDGSFAFPDAPANGVVIAELGDRRSRPAPVADGLTLSLQPTSRIDGRVELHGASTANLLVDGRLVEDDPKPIRYSFAAPLLPDGRFSLGGVPREKLRLHATLWRQTAGMASAVVDAHAPVVEGVLLEVPATQRTIYVVVRSTVATPVGNAQVIVVPGAQASTNARAFAQAVPSATRALAQSWDAARPEPLAAVGRRGDLFAKIAAPASGGTACAVGLPAELTDNEQLGKMQAHNDKVEVRCTPIPRDENIVVVEVPPLPRFD